jgi:mono/diheme cytochrome c family protein
MRWRYEPVCDGQPERRSIVHQLPKSGVPTFAAAVLSLLMGPHSAIAADPSRGLLLARGWCVSCHLVEPSGKASDAAPPFGSIARDPATTSERLHHWLAKPHPPMPDLRLSRDEEDDILAYILSLKSQ